MKPMLSVLYSHADEIAASGIGVGTSVMLTSSTPIDPDNLWTVLGLLPGILGPALAVLAGRWSAARGARKRARADYLAAEGKAKLIDSDRTNDEAGRAQMQEAAELKAEADALERRDD